MTQSPNHHLAQLNIGRIVAPLDDPVMAGFVNRLADINVLADRSPGFVWRLQSDAGDATSFRPYDDDRILVNLSVWESVEALRAYVYKSEHGDVMRDRRQWFEKFDGPYMVLWWIPAGHIPTVWEAKARLEHLQQYGESEYAFTFRHFVDAPNPHNISKYNDPGVAIVRARWNKLKDHYQKVAYDDTPSNSTAR